MAPHWEAAWLHNEYEAKRRSTGDIAAEAGTTDAAIIYWLKKRGSKSLHVHHKKPWAGNPELRFDPSNVVTLCRKCHGWVHSKANASGEYLR